MFRKKEIDEWAFDYWLLQRYAKFCFQIYYRKITVINRHRIPAGQPIILAPNHQNALMDAMVLVCSFPFQNIFLARADIFKGKRLIKFLTYLNIMPIYRMRDGIENVKRNDEVFEKTVQVLHNARNPLCIFPEGNHGDKRRLRPLVKGLFRIALQAQEKFGTYPGVKIVPVGFDYKHYQHFRTDLFVNIGNPIEMSDYYQLYSENPVAAINQLKDDFAAALSKQMIDIQSTEYYDLYMALREIFNDDMRLVAGINDQSPESRFEADKKLIEILNIELERNPGAIHEMDAKIQDYLSDLKKENLRDWVLKKDKYSLLNLASAVLVKILFFPVFLFGFIHHVLPYYLTASRVKSIKDTQFHSSIKYVIGMLIFPLWYLILGGILAVAGMPFLYLAAYVLMLLPAGLFAFNYYIGLRKLSAKIRYTLHHRKPSVISLQNKRKDVAKFFLTIIKPNLTNENKR